VRPADHLRARASAVKCTSDSRRPSLSLASCALGFGIRAYPADLKGRIRDIRVLDRHNLTEGEWALLELLLPDRTPRRSGRWANHQMVINGCSGGPSAGCHRRTDRRYGAGRPFSRWSGNGNWAVWVRLLLVGA
jgi:hypothetical protein